MIDRALKLQVDDTHYFSRKRYDEFLIWDLPSRNFLHLIWKVKFGICERQGNGKDTYHLEVLFLRWDKEFSLSTNFVIGAFGMYHRKILARKSAKDSTFHGQPAIYQSDLCTLLMLD